MADNKILEPKLLASDFTESPYDVFATLGDENGTGAECTSGSLDIADDGRTKRNAAAERGPGDSEKGGWRSALSSIRQHKALIAASVSASLGSAAQFGYAIGMLNTIRPVIISEFQDNTTCSVDFDANSQASASSKINFQLSTAIICLGGLLGSLVAGPFADRFGRKVVLLANNIFAIIAGITMALASSFPALMAGRVFQGLVSGIGLVVVATYLSEIAPTSLRGAVGIVAQVAISSAIVFATVLGLPAVLGTCGLWNVVVAGPVLLSALQLATLPFYPESPKFLFLTRGDRIAAKIALQRLRGAGVSIAKEMEEMEAEKARQVSQKVTVFWKAIRDRRLRSRFLLTAILHSTQQLAGSNFVLFYSTAIYSSAGLTDVALIALVPALVKVLVVFVSFKIVELLGRRKLMLMGLAGLVISHVVLTAGFAFNNHYFFMKKGANWTSALTITGSLGVVISFSLGPGPIPWLVVSELFPQSSRGTGYIVAGVVNWLMNYIVTQFFLQIVLILFPYGFLVFAGIAILLFLAVFFLQPETKGKRIEQIDEFFNENSPVDRGISFAVGRLEIGADARRQ